MARAHDTTSRSKQDYDHDLSADDSRSVSSSSSDDNREYDIQRILTEEVSDGELFYLVKWVGYSDERCTWEPKEQFMQSSTLEQWERQRDSGDMLEEAQLQEVLAKMEAYEERRQRKLNEKTRRKRRRLSRTADADNATTQVEKIRIATNHRQLPGNDTSAKVFSWSSQIIQPRNGNITETKKPDFHGPLQPSTAKRTSFVKRKRTSNELLHRFGKPFRNLREMNIYQKGSTGESAPSSDVIHLIAATELEVTEPAHLLPSGRLRMFSSCGSSLKDGRERSKILLVQNRRSHDLQSSKAGEVSENLPVADIRALYRSERRPSGLLTEQEFERQPSENPHITKARNGRSWQRGELLVFMQVCGQDVGDVKFRYLESWIRSALLSTKRATQSHVLTLAFDRTMAFPDYQRLLDGPADILAVGDIDGYEDTQSNIDDVAINVLEKSELALIWTHPSVHFILVAYSVNCPIWRFLGQGYQNHTSARIRVTAHKRFSGFLEGNKNVELLTTATSFPRISNASPDQNQTASALERSHQTNTLPDRLRSPLQQCTNNAEVAESPNSSSKHCASTTAFMTYQSPIQSDSAANEYQVLAPPERELSIKKKVDHTRAGEPFRLGLRRVQEDAGIFRSLEDMKGSGELRRDLPTSLSEEYYRYLTKLPRNATRRYDRNRARFFLAFPDDQRQELDQLRTFLYRHTLKSLVYSVTDNQGWETFLEIFKGESLGVILLSNRYTSFEIMPGLGSWLGGESLQVFKVSRQASANGHEAWHTALLFPRSTVWLLTEASIIRFPAQSLEFLRWFRTAPSQERRLMLRPNGDVSPFEHMIWLTFNIVKHWLKKYAASSRNVVLRKTLLDLLVILQELSPFQPKLDVENDKDTRDSSERESLSGEETQEVANFIISPSELAGYGAFRERNQEEDLENRDATLVDYFGGWSCARVESFRRFIAITPFASTKRSKLCHIKFVTPEVCITTMIRSKRKPSVGGGS